MVETISTAQHLLNCAGGALLAGAGAFVLATLASALAVDVSQGRAIAFEKKLVFALIIGIATFLLSY